MIDKTIDLLGHKATDKVTGFAGVITSVCFDLYGCVQAIVSPPVKPGEPEVKGGHWFDVQRLVVSGEVVMPVPDFAARAPDPASYTSGPADKPEITA